jgi:hypothetical protein
MAALTPLLQAMKSLKTANDALAYLRDVDKKFDKAELKLKVVELTDLLADTQRNVNEAQKENDALRARIDELEQAQDVAGNVFTRGNLYFKREEDGESGPFCPRCYVKEEMLMPLTKLDPIFRDMGSYNCPECKAVF